MYFVLLNPMVEWLRGQVSFLFQKWNAFSSYKEQMLTEWLAVFHRRWTFDQNFLIKHRKNCECCPQCYSLLPGPYYCYVLRFSIVKKNQQFHDFSWIGGVSVIVFVIAFFIELVFVFVFVFVIVVVFLLVRSCFLIILIKCLKGHNSQRSLFGGVL